MTPLIYVAAAIAEITGCCAFWAWLRLDKSPIWLLPGTLSLVMFAWLLAFVETNVAGRAYAAYGGVYICASLFWLWAVEARGPTVGTSQARPYLLSARRSYSPHLAPG